MARALSPMFLRVAIDKNPGMRTVAKILRARALEDSSNFCEQFESQILRALLNWMGPFNTPYTCPTLVLTAILGAECYTYSGFQGVLHVGTVCKPDSEILQELFFTSFWTMFFFFTHLQELFLYFIPPTPSPLLDTDELIMALWAEKLPGLSRNGPQETKLTV